MKTAPPRSELAAWICPLPRRFSLRAVYVFSSEEGYSLFLQTLCLCDCLGSHSSVNLIPSSIPVGIVQLMLTSHVEARGVDFGQYVEGGGRVGVDDGRTELLLILVLALLVASS